MNPFICNPPSGRADRTTAGIQTALPAHHRKDVMQSIILKIAKWLIQYVEGYHISKNRRKKKA